MYVIMEKDTLIKTVENMAEGYQHYLLLCKPNLHHQVMVSFANLLIKPNSHLL